MMSILLKLHWTVLILIFSLGNHIWSEARPKQVPFIVNGWEADRGRWPWQVAIMLGIRTHRQVCGGVLLSPKFILSAAHCTQYDPAFYNVWIGGHDLNDLAEGQMIGIKRMINHPKYNGSSESFPNDISVVELSWPAALNDAAKPAVLPEPGENFLNSECYISGWGKTDSRIDKKPKAPHEVNMTVLSHNACVTAMADEKDKEILDTHICVIHESKESSACQGDSGGPLQCRRSPRDAWIVAGVTSWGKGDDNITCYQSHPSVYTRISSYINWIKQNTDSSIQTSGNVETTPITPKETTSSPADKADTTLMSVSDKRTTNRPDEVYKTIKPTDEGRTTPSSYDTIRTTANSIFDTQTITSNDAGTSGISMGDKRTTFSPAVSSGTTERYFGDRRTTASSGDHIGTTVSSAGDKISTVSTINSVDTSLDSPGEKMTTSSPAGSINTVANSPGGIGTTRNPFEDERTTVDSGHQIDTTAKSKDGSSTGNSGLSTTTKGDIQSTNHIGTTEDPDGAIRTTLGPSISISTTANPVAEKETTTYIYERETTTLNTSDGVSANNTLRGFGNITTPVFNGTTQSTQRPNPNIVSGSGVTRGRYCIIELFLSLYMIYAYIK